MTDNDPITRLEHALEQLGAEHEPPRGWEARVLAVVQPRPRVRWWWFAIPAAAVVLAVVSGALLWPSRPTQLALTVERSPGSRPSRGEHQVGDRIRATVHGGAGHHAIWVYRGETELVAVCPGGTGCGGGDGALSVELTLDRIGSYRVIALSADGALPVPHGAYDGDLAAAMAAHAIWKQEVVEAQ